MTGLLYGANVHANGIRQHYLRYGGKGRPLVLIPGITSPAVTWEFVALELARHFDVYVPDARGRGLSSSGPDLDYGLDAMADDVAAFVTALGLENYVLLGHSMGARIAIRMVRENANGVAKLILVDPPMTGPGRRAYPAPRSWYVDSIRLMQRGAGWEELRAFSPTWTEAELRLRAEWLHTCDEDAIVRSYNDFHDTDIHSDLPSIAVPTLLVAASRGGVVIQEDLEEVKRLNGAIGQTVVADAGHMIPWDNFDGFFAAINPFLDDMKEASDV